MTLFQALVLGVVQGLTEFLPVSSTAHLRIVPALAGWHFGYAGGSNDPGAAFTAIVQLGTMVAIVVYFWRELLHVIVAWCRGFVDKPTRATLEYRFGWYLIFATIPVGVFGLIFRHQIETGARNLWLIASALILLALVLLAAERIGTRTRDEERIVSTDAVVIGTAQALALIPGVSRSGATISAGLFRGLTREAAARFSFLLSIPAVVLSGVFEAARISGEPSPGAGLTGLAVVVSFAVGLASIHWLMRWLGHHSTYVFIGYRIGLGLLLIGLLAGGVLQATD